MITAETLRAFAPRIHDPQVHASALEEARKTSSVTHRVDFVTSWVKSSLKRAGLGAWWKIGITDEPEGGDPEIASVFFANIGRAEQKKLIIICLWPQVHYDFRGKLCANFVYEAPHPDTKATKLKFEDGISKQLKGGCECEWRDGTRRIAKYKTASEVKAALRTIGP